MHARQLRAHVDALAARRYPTAFRPAAPFTVLFVPSDGFLTTALEAEPGLLEYGFARDVVLATPEHAAGPAAHGRLLVAAGAAGPRRRPGARGRPPAARPAEHAVRSPHPARLGAGHDDDPLQRDGRLLRAVGAHRRPPLRRPRRRREPGARRPSPLEATVRTLRPPEPAEAPTPWSDGEDRFEAGRRYDDEGRDGTRG